MRSELRMQYCNVNKPNNTYEGAARKKATPGTRCRSAKGGEEQGLVRDSGRGKAGDGLLARLETVEK